jgi:hypothetical protein
MSSSDTDPTALEREGQRDADKLEDRSKQLGQDIEDVNQDWQQKRADESVPGAKTPDNPDGESDEEPEDSGEDRDGESEDKSDEKSDDESDEV